MLNIQLITDIAKMILKSEFQEVILFGAKIKDETIFGELVFYASAIYNPTVTFIDSKGNKYLAKIPSEVLYQAFPSRGYQVDLERLE
ncbi:MAG: hypothetical protein ACRDBG_11180 [Waterburya sp.]